MKIKNLISIFICRNIALINQCLIAKSGDFMHNLEQVLFKTKAHLQRGVGITKVPTGNLKRVNIDYTRIESTCHDSKPTVIVNYLVQMFKNRFGDFSHLDAQ